MRIKEALLSCLLGLSAAAGDAAAVTLDPGEIEPLFGTTAAARPELGGVVLEDALRPFVIDLGGGLSITGTIQDRVVRSDVDNTLIFSYYIMSDATSAGSILFASRTDYTAATTDVDWRIDGPGVDAPSFAFRHPGAHEVSFFFTSQSIAPGEDSLFFFIKTDATTYNEGGQGLLAGLGTNGHGASVLFPTFQPFEPSQAVPVPPALWLFVSGIVGLVTLSRRPAGGDRAA